MSMTFDRIVGTVFALLLFSCPSQAQEARLALEGMGPGPAEGRAFVDVDGDGRDDFCFTHGGSGYNLKCLVNKPSGTNIVNYDNLWASPAGRTRWADVNGDSFVDACKWAQISEANQGLVCRLGPAFTGAPVTQVLQLAGLSTCWGDCTPEFIPGVAVVQGGEDPDYHLADVNGDGVPDLCYVWNKDNTYYDMRCRVATVSNSRQTVNYATESAVWTLANMGRGRPNWPEGFFDFNGDGTADYCRLWSDNRVACATTSAGGFVLPEVFTAAAIKVDVWQGAQFVDINADGNVDFCRPFTAHVRCTLSNGVGWEFGGSIGESRELTSPTLEHGFGDMQHGHANWRWWVDVNGDGYPDYCRLIGGDLVGDGETDKTGNLRCRLGRGGDHASGPQVAFSHSDVVVANLNVGRSDAGRSFCDAFGTGVPAFCRVSIHHYLTSEEICVGTESYPEVLNNCYPVMGTLDTVIAGYPGGLIQAQQGLLTVFTDGVGAETRLSYLPMTNAQVYTRSNTTSNPDLRLLTVLPRSPVVFETRAWTRDHDPAMTLTGNARYMYKDLLTDTWAGSRGFRERWIFHEGTNTLDHTVYYQGLGASVEGATSGSVQHDLREIGLPKCQEKFAVLDGLIPEPAAIAIELRGRRDARLVQIRNRVKDAPNTGPCSIPSGSPDANVPFVLLQVTNNLLGVTESVENPRFKFVKQSTVQSWDWTLSGRKQLPTSTTKTKLDAWGNVTLLEQSTVDLAGREWKKTTVNEYNDNPTSWLLGRLKKATATTVSPTATVQLAALPFSHGTAANANSMIPPGGTQAPPPPAAPPSVALRAILQFLLDDD